jgi:hypothetical protein
LLLHLLLRLRLRLLLGLGHVQGSTRPHSHEIHQELGIVIIPSLVRHPRTLTGDALVVPHEVLEKLVWSSSLLLGSRGENLLNMLWRRRTTYAAVDPLSAVLMKRLRRCQVALLRHVERVDWRKRVTLRQGVTLGKRDTLGQWNALGKWVPLRWRRKGRRSRGSGAHLLLLKL